MQMDDVKEQMLALLDVLGDEEVVKKVAQTNMLYLSALQSYGFTRDEAMQLVVASTARNLAK
jgi:Fe-S cluster assembly scaffold protein SufB